MEKESSKQFVYVPPCAKSRCLWNPKSTEETPHSKYERSLVKPKILPDAIEAIGQTPMVRINKLAKEYGIECQLLAKCEFLNPGGSLKDRIVPRMIEDAEKAGLVKPGCTLIAPTSGNTGIGAAMYAAVRGYRIIIVMPMKMSKEKADTMKALGAEIIRTPNTAGYLSLESPFAVAQKLHQEIPNSFILDQYTSASNALAHYDVTAEEILDQCDGALDMIIIGTGTGGTLTGIGRKLKEKCPNCQVVAVDPVGSIMANPENLSSKSFFEVEGIGHDFVPTVCDSSVADHWFKVHDKDTMLMARRLIRDEGLLCGGSSGANMVAALSLAKTLKPDQKCVVLLPDGLRNYMTKFLSDEWMLERNFMEADPAVKEQWWSDIPVAKLMAEPGERIKTDASCEEALQIMKNKGLDGLPVVEDDGAVIGLITKEAIINGILEGKCPSKGKVADFFSTDFRKVNSKMLLAQLAYILKRERLVAVVSGDKDQKEQFLGTLSKMDFIDFISNKNPMWGWSPRWTC